MGNVRIIIRAVPERQEYIDYLRAELPDAEFCMDEKRNAMHTFLKAKKMAGDDPAIHMEDDAILTTDFVRKANDFISQHPDEVIQFFSRRNKDLTVGTRRENGGNFSCNVCYYLPAFMSKRILAYFPVWDNKWPASMPYDTMMADFFRRQGISYIIHVPSLVNHREGLSQINSRRNSRRHSQSFLP